jgi:hypothetical protein
MMKYYFIVAMAAAILASCTEKANVTGQLTNSPETFSGKITNYDSHRGRLMLTSNMGAGCQGDFTHKSERLAVGVMNCTDGRSGSFTLSSGEHGGMGNGVLNNQPFNFSFIEE